MGAWVAEITDRETHTQKWVGSFHTTELAALEYNRWQVRFQDEQACHNFPRFTTLLHLALVAPGVVDAAMARGERDVRERLMAEEASEVYMADLCR
ncbi:Bifunctional dihydroflavonol 4-reductase/flavanone 4-reductase [Hordeum vulgare]|nr:Bifunctional dihydroflavonol 4-reductase/flavanone 4-reductase [Hordeum vulgare]